MAFNLLEAKVEYEGERVLVIRGKVNYNAINPEHQVLIDNVRCKNGIPQPYMQLNMTSVPKFIDKIYRFKLLLDGISQSPTYKSKMQINIRGVSKLI